MSVVHLVNGAFQDILGNPVANGYILLVLSQEAIVNSTSLALCEGFTITIPLDSNGNITTIGNQVWPNAQLSPSNTFYAVSVYTENGQLVWGPNSQTVTSPGPFDVGNWVPGIVT